MAKKFIIEENKIRIGEVNNHSDLVENKGVQIHGGGLWMLYNGELRLYGTSGNFGKFNKEAIKTAELPKDFKQYKLKIMEF